MEDLIEVLEINMEKSNKKKSYYFLKIFTILFISLFYIEIVFRYLAFKNIYSMEIIRIIFFTATTSLVISFFTSLFKEKGAKIMMLLTMLFIGAYAIIQLNFKNFMGNYMSFNAAGDGLGRVGEQIKTFFMYIKPIYLLCLLPLLLLIILFVFAKSILIYEKSNYQTIIKRALIVVLIHLISLSTLYVPFLQNPNQIKDNKSLYKKPILLELSLRQFGIVRFLVRDVIYMFHPTEQNLIIVDTNKEDKLKAPDRKSVV